MTLKRIRGLIVFTILILVGFWNFDIVLDVLGVLWGIIFPFVLGGAIAFVINVPMSFLEGKLFGKDREERGKVATRLARPVSLVLTLAIVVGVIAIVMFVLVPQLGDTFASLGSSISAFIPQLQSWVAEFTHNNPDIMSWMEQL